MQSFSATNYYKFKTLSWIKRKNTCLIVYSWKYAFQICKRYNYLCRNFWKLSRGQKKLNSYYYPYQNKSKSWSNRKISSRKPYWKVFLFLCLFNLFLLLFSWILFGASSCDDPIKSSLYSTRQEQTSQCHRASRRTDRRDRHFRNGGSWVDPEDGRTFALFWLMLQKRAKLPTFWKQTT